MTDAARIVILERLIANQHEQIDNLHDMIRVLGDRADLLELLNQRLTLRIDRALEIIATFQRETQP